MSTTGDRIKSARKAKGLTQSDLAKMIGVKYSAIHKYETGLIVNLKRETIAKLAEALDVKPSYLMGWEDELLASISEESVRDRTSAKEEMYRLFGTDHSAEDLRVLGDKLVLLYYRAADRRFTLALADIIAAVENLDMDEIENIQRIVRAYLRAEPNAKGIVDLALAPYIEEETFDVQVG